MRLGIMQPYFFPYLGYFDLINCADRWIVFDDVQYIRHGWINRNRILHPAGGWSYIIVPVKSSRESLIREVKILDDGKWKRRILGQLQTYKKGAPYFQEVMDLVENCFAYGGDLISQFNTFILEKVCSYIGIRFNYTIFSEMKLKLHTIDGPGDWALRISEAVGATEYVNPPGGVGIFDPEKFKAASIKLTIRQLPALEYQCTGYEFIPHLSIIDLLMWNSPQQIKSHLEQYVS